MNALGIKELREPVTGNHTLTLVYFECGCDGLHFATRGYLDVLTRDWCSLHHYLNKSLTFRGFSDDDFIARLEKRTQSVC